MKTIPHPEQKWTERNSRAIPPELTQHLNLPEFVLQLLVQRGIIDLQSATAFLDFRKYTPASPFDFPDMNKAVNLALDAVRNNQKIGVWGDFDVDGQTATSILVSALRALGADVVYHIPIRKKESHGIQLDALKEFLARGVNLIITCDTGITALESIAYAQSNGVNVIVTDHHSLPENLPTAFALINPHFLPDSHPLVNLPGAGVAYKFAEALLAQSNKMDFSATLHDLAALGAIADLAELKGDTRYLTQSGLELIRETPRPALNAMLKAVEINPAMVNEEHISFLLAPRLNAVGRLDDANPMVDFLLSTDETQIAVMVNQLEGLNARRKTLCDQVFKGALAQIEKDFTLLDQPVIVLTHPEWPAGIAGVAASRLVQMFHRPVILLTGSETGLLRGSARSIEGVDITASIRVLEQSLFSYGGHAMAAGLALQGENLPRFKRELSKVVQQSLDTSPVKKELVIDQFIPPQDLTIEMLRSVEALAPFGPGNPQVTFAVKDMHVSDTRAVGKTGEHLQVMVEDREGNLTKLIWWQGAGMPQPEGEFDLAYSAHAVNYRGDEQIQVEWIDYREKTESLSIKTQPVKSQIKNIDLRNSSDLDSVYAQVSSLSDPMIWKEGMDETSGDGRDRENLGPAKTLVFWTIPPDPCLLRSIITKAKPETIIWILRTPKEHELKFFLMRIVELIKKNIRAGIFTIDLEQLAQLTAANSQMVALAVNWLAARGDITIESSSATLIKIIEGGRKNLDTSRQFEKALSISFEEVKSYHRFLERVNLDTLVSELGQ